MSDTGRRGPAERWGPALLALAGGVLAALAHPPFGFLPGVFGYALVLWALDRPARRRWGSAFRRGWASGVGYLGVSTLWIAEPFLIDAEAHAWQIPFAMAGVAGGIGLLWGVGGVLHRLFAWRGGRAGSVLAFAAAFSLAEWLRGHILTGFPWDLPGETFRAGSALSQGAALVDVYGLTPVVLLAGAAPVLLWGGERDARRRMAVLAGAAILIGGVGLWGEARLRAPAAPAAAAPVRVRVVQPDLPEPPSWSPEVLQRALDRYTALTAAAPPDGRIADLVVWPEGALPAPLDVLLDPAGEPHRRIAAALRPGQILLTGAARAESAGPDARWFNTLAALRRTPDGLVLEGLYDKHHLVPFGEYLPWPSLLGRLGLRKLVSVAADFSAGPPPRPLRLSSGVLLQPLICYEALFPGLAKATAERPRLLLNISDDAWFGRDMGPWQHLNLASHRAIEAGLPMVRATPTGVSAVIDAQGRPVRLLPPGRAGVIDANVPAPSPPAASAASAAVQGAAFWLISGMLIILGLFLSRDILCQRPLKS